MKLSKTQNECLQHLKDNNTFLHYMEYMGRFNPNAYYFASGTMKRFRDSTVKNLIKLGYLKIVKDNGYGKHEVILNNK